MSNFPRLGKPVNYEQLRAEYRRNLPSARPCATEGCKYNAELTKKLCQDCQAAAEDKYLHGRLEDDDPSGVVPYVSDGGRRYEVSYLTKFGIKNVERFGRLENAEPRFRSLKGIDAANLTLVDTSIKTPARLLEYYYGNRKV